MHNERMEILPLRQISWLHVNNQQLKLFFKKPRTKIVAGLLLWNKGHSPNKIETWRAAFKETYAKISQLSWILVPTNISGGSHDKLARHKKQFTKLTLGKRWTTWTGHHWNPWHQNEEHRRTHGYTALDVFSSIISKMNNCGIVTLE